MNKPIHFKKIRNSLILLVLLVILPSMIGLIFYVLVEQRRDARQQAQETALRIARLAAREQETLIAGAHHLLITLAELPEVRERRAGRCSQLLSGISKNFRYYTTVAAATPQGDIFCSSLPNHRTQPNIADRAYFQDALKERRLSISHALVGRMSGKPAIAIAYPAVGDNGEVQAIVFVGLDLSWLKNVATMAQLPAKARVLAIDEVGNVFIRYTHEEKFPETSTANPSLIKTIVTEKEGFTEAVGSDGVQRLFGFTTFHRVAKSSALFIAVGIPNEVAFAISKRIFYGSVVVFLVSSFLAAATTWLGAHILIRRNLEKLIAAARTLGDGELNETSASPPALAASAGQFKQVIAEMRSALQKATGRQADFAAMIAHDLRNPLQMIHGAASLLPQAKQMKQNEQVFLDMIRSGCEELTQMLNEFIDFSKYKAGYLRLDKEEFDLRDFFSQLATQYAWQAQQRGISLKVELDGRIGPVNADRKKLHQLLDNLLSNALKFTPAGGEICIGARAYGDGIELRVRDTGVGIAAEEVKNLFSLYRQTASGKSSSSKGTGLGLLVSKMIAEAHDGEISVRSEPGKGAMFTIALPSTSSVSIAAAPERIRDEPSISRPQGSGL